MYVTTAVCYLWQNAIKYMYNEISKCCGKPKVANYSDEGTGCYLCQGCLGEFIPQEAPPSKCAGCRAYYTGSHQCDGLMKVLVDEFNKKRDEEFDKTFGKFEGRNPQGGIFNQEHVKEFMKKYG